MNRISSWRFTASKLFFCFAVFVSSAFGPASDGHAEFIYESHAIAATGGGGFSVGTNIFHGTTFRFTDRVQVSALGIHGHSFPASSIFSSLYKVNTPDSAPDVVNDTNLLGSTLINMATGADADRSGPLSLTLEPGWYSLLAGTGRYGATAANSQIKRI
jgi:hypothetical protein